MHQAPLRGAGGIVNANTDMLPGACLDWFTVQHFVEVADRDVAIAWATPDAPLVCLQDINRGKWQTKLPMTNGHLYAYVMNNYWHTNYLAGQGGDYTFRFAITSRPKADNVASAQFGWAVSNPLMRRCRQGEPAGAVAGGPTSLVSVAEPNVIVDRRQAGRRGQRPGRAALGTHRAADHGPPAARSAYSGGEGRGLQPGRGARQPLEIRDGEVAVPIRGSGLATVRIENRTLSGVQNAYAFLRACRTTTPGRRPADVLGQRPDQRPEIFEAGRRDEVALGVDVLVGHRLGAQGHLGQRGRAQRPAIRVARLADDADHHARACPRRPVPRRGGRRRRPLPRRRG